MPLARHAAVITVLVATLLVTACAGGPALRKSEEQWNQGQLEDAVLTLEAASRAAPQDLQLRSAWIRKRDLAAAQLLGQADSARAVRRNEDSRTLYSRVLRIDPANARARDGLAAIAVAERHAQLVTEAETLLQKGDPAGAEVRLRTVLAENRANADARRAMQRVRENQLAAEPPPPQLRTALSAPITLEFRDTPIRAVFDVISRTAGLNFVFDRDVRADTRVTVFIRNSPIEDVLKLILATNQLDRKQLNDNSLLIYPNTQAKQREYQELVVRSFFLANADVKLVQNLLRTVLKTRDLHVDEKLNVITMRDTPDAVRLAERLLETVDLSEPEVMLEVEVLEISRQRAREIGLSFPTQVTLDQLAAPFDTGPSVGEGRARLRSPNLIATVVDPALRLNLLSSNTDTNLLANPRIRAKNREKAKVLIGEKVPVFTTTAVQNAGVSSSVSYLDVGLRLEVEPTVFLEDEVGIKVFLEVSSNLGEVKGPNGTTAFRIGTRSAQTALRLRDGETQVLAGLINDNERETFSRLPGLGDIPGVGRAFGTTKIEGDKTEIVLLITPRIVRNIVAPDLERAQVAAGTESAAGVPPLAIRATPSRSMAMSARAAPGSAAVPSALPPSSSAVGRSDGAPPGSADPSPAAVGPLTATLTAPETVSIGREFVVLVQVANAGGASVGDVELAVDGSLLQSTAGGSPGRVSVRLTSTGETLDGSAVVRAQAAGAGSASISVASGAARLKDGTVVPITGGSAQVRIGP